MSFLKNKYTRILTLVLLLQAFAYYAVALRGETTPPIAPLSMFPTRIGEWTMVTEAPIDPAQLAVLKADDTINRVYVNSSRTADLAFFIAFFNTQRYGQAPHSPKNCLPGAGWEPLEDSKLTIDIPGHGPIETNKYVVAHGEQKNVTLYWYQSHGRVIASEYWAKFWLVTDAIRYRRSDTSLVKVFVPVRGNDISSATSTGVEFVKAAFPSLLKQFPN